jgi:Secretion system C-terminal sorting domain
MSQIKTKWNLLLFLFSITSFYAQETTLSSGGEVSGSGGSGSYAVGQVVYTTATNGSETMAQGVQQNYEITTLGNNNFPDINLAILAYPNPTISFLNLKIDHLNFDGFDYQLFDLQGKKIQTQKVRQTETKIEMGNLPVAIYVLSVSNSKGKIFKSFRIIKK